MNLMFQLKSNGAKKEFIVDTSYVEQLKSNIGNESVSAITECKMILMNQNHMEELIQGDVEICGMTSELLLKTCRFYFYEKAWELLQSILPKLSTYSEHKKRNGLDDDLYTLYQYTCIFSLDHQINLAKLDETVDYLQSLEDSIRCGQITFKDNLTDTNVNRNRLATLLVASNFEFVNQPNDIENLVTLIQELVPDYVLAGTNSHIALWNGLEKMIDYINSICD